MTYESETPAGSRAGVSWKSLDRTSTINPTRSARRTQHVISKHELRLEREAMFHTLALGGQDHGV